MQAEGKDIYIPADRIELSPITIKRGEAGGQVCQIHGLIYYVIPLVMIANSRVIIRDYRIYSEWEEIGIELLLMAQRNGRYKLGHLDYAVGEVLNDRLESAFA